MFIREAVKRFGAVYKLCSHGAVREGCAVGRFIAWFLLQCFLHCGAICRLAHIHSCFWVPTCYKIDLGWDDSNMLQGVNDS